jgi:deazaflavin-dependent oxidoreductase (nitroreductase family)
MTETMNSEFWHALNGKVADEFRANAGKVEGFNGADMLLLNTIGAKSGQPRLAPLAYFTIDGKLLVVGSKAGADHDPDWVHNLRAHRQAHVELGTTSHDVIARELSPVERDETYPKIVALASRFGDYQAMTSRKIPLFELTWRNGALPESEDAEYWHALNSPVVDEFRANDGRVARFGGADLLLLTTTGARSGLPRLAPLARLTIDGKLIIVGSLGGADHDPDWVRNLRANQRAHVELGTTGYDVVARELDPVERDRTYPKVVAVHPVFGEYQAKTSRVIPLFELTRA